MALSVLIQYITNGLIAMSVLGGIEAFRSGNVDLGVSLVFAAPLVVLTPRFIYKRHFKKYFGLIFLAEIEALVLTFLALSILGEVYFYENVPLFDSFVHFASGILIAVLVVALFYEKYLTGKLKPSLIIIFGGVVPALINEIYEASADAILGTKLWGDIYWTNIKPLWIDTTSDVLLEIIGAVVAVSILKRYFRVWLRRWGYENTQEQPPLLSPHSKQV